jgi:hypothetical protein
MAEMNIESLIKKAKKNKYVIISQNQLNNLLSYSKLIQEKESQISGKIRLLKFNGELLIQEKTDKDELLIRLMKTKEEADYFIKERLEIYDKMWDGCGCKVDYYN